MVSDNFPIGLNSMYGIFINIISTRFVIMIKKKISKSLLHSIYKYVLLFTIKECAFCFQFGSDFYNSINIEPQWYSNGNKKIEFTPKKGFKGYYDYTEWRENGILKIHGRILVKDGYSYRDGKWERWYKNGQLRSRVFYRYDYLVGEGSYYSPDGSFEYSKNYFDSSKVIPFKDSEGYIIGNVNPGNHYPEDGVWIYDGPFVRIKTNYLDWRRNGLHQEWTSGNGKILVEGHYLNGKKHGVWINYHQSALDYDNSTGIKSYEITYVNGKKNGTIVKYYQTGSKEYEGSMDEEKKIGQWKYFSVDGILEKSIDCNNQECN